MMGRDFCDAVIRRQMGLNVVEEESKVIRQRFNSSSSLYWKNIVGHFGCINALELDEKGDWMASGGDDRRILIWNVEKTIDCIPSLPIEMEGKHESNIFCLGFDCRAKKILSGGNDERILIHDLATTKFVNQYLQEEPVFGISCHPENSDIFTTACSDGQVMMFDLRSSSHDEELVLATSPRPFHSVEFNPVEPRLILTANQASGVCMWDLRKPRHPVMEYGSLLSNLKSRSAMSAVFNSNGSQIAALGRRQPVILYNIESPLPLHEFDHPGYFNSCTMKKGCFGGINDQLILSGSDDFNVYVWQIPNESSSREDAVDVLVDRAELVLRGHRSIVNQVRYNNSRHFLASSGVEKIIKLWSPLYLPGGLGNLDGSTVVEIPPRKLCSRSSYIQMVVASNHLAQEEPTNSSLKESPQMLAFFDDLVRREGSTSDETNSDDSSTASTTSSGGSESKSRDSNENISQVINRKRKNLMRKRKERSLDEIDSVFETSVEIRAMTMARKVLRLNSNSTTTTSSENESEDSATSQPGPSQGEPIEMPAALQTSPSNWASDGIGMREEITNALREELEQPEVGRECDNTNSEQEKSKKFKKITGPKNRSYRKPSQEDNCQI